MTKRRVYHSGVLGFGIEFTGVGYLGSGDKLGAFVMPFVLPSRSFAPREQSIIISGAGKYRTLFYMLACLLLSPILAR